MIQGTECGEIPGECLQYKPVPVCPHLSLSHPHLPFITAGQSRSSLQSPASPEELTQLPPAPAPGILTLSWELTRVAVQERRKMFVSDIKLSDMTGTTETIWD